MKALVVFAHPNFNSFNGAVLKTVVDTLEQKKAEIRVKDLYKMGWNPLLSTEDFQQLYSGKVPPDIAREQEDVTWAEALIFIYPIWWLERPAILKGWFDRVFSHGFAYAYTKEGMAEGLIKGKKAVIITTSGANEENMRQNGVLDAVNTCVINGTFGFSGFEDTTYQNLYQVPSVTDQERQNMLQQVEKLINQL